MLDPSSKMQPSQGTNIDILKENMLKDFCFQFKMNVFDHPRCVLGMEFNIILLFIKSNALKRSNYLFLGNTKQL